MSLMPQVAPLYAFFEDGQRRRIIAWDDQTLAPLVIGNEGKLRFPHTVGNVIRISEDTPKPSRTTRLIKKVLGP